MSAFTARRDVEAAPARPHPAIQVENVTVHYGEVLALDAASLVLEHSRICGLVGMNGSGKSTLFKAIMGMIRPDAGRVLINGAPPAKARKEGGIGYVPQSEDVDWQFPLSVHDVVMMGRYGRQGFTRRPSKADRAAVDDALERVELSDFAGRQIGQLRRPEKTRLRGTGHRAGSHHDAPGRAVCRRRQAFGGHHHPAAA
jgi:manganese transport system ATP-binding protein